ncbi:TraM recognition domain-containing protein [Mycolicibacterium conceptionense]|uniref:TraM recognition domain-containing protein n=1 Tax=Mycolicibacterium conceptionense TaxID=451644 RepID=UPI003204D99A
MSQRPEPYSPYCGLVYNGKGHPERVTGAPHLAISAPTRTGKTRRLLAPAAVLHPGPLVAVSSKEDLAELVLTRRCFGPTGVIDLRPEKTLVWPQGVTQMVTDPTMSITSATEALTVAETMLATSGVGFGGGSSGQTVAAGGLWESTASRPLACLLYAASPQGNSQGMPWVLEAVEKLGIEDDDQDGNNQMTLTAEPSWATAAALCPHPMLADPMQRVLTFNSRMRDSVAITVSKAVTPWVRLGLAATDHLDRPSPIEQLSIESFDVSMLDEPDASLFVIAPNTGTVAGAAVALIDSIIRHFRKRTAQHQMQHRLLLELDEVCNSCPLPALLNYVGESAGLGVNIMATVQASSHFDVVFGPKYADALRDIFPGTVVMYGAHERYLLEQGSHWSGLATRRSESYEPHGGSRSQSSQFGAAIDWQELLPQSLEEARLLIKGAAGSRVQIPDWSQFLALYDQAIEARRERSNGDRVAGRAAAFRN